jgi:hypothetical protein
MDQVSSHLVGGCEPPEKQGNMPILLGCIADDFTGATDLANTLVKNGIRATQLIGVPKRNAEVGDAEAVVVALKSRTAPVEQAVSASLAALRWLQGNGAGRIALLAVSLLPEVLDERRYRQYERDQDKNPDQRHAAHHPGTIHHHSEFLRS